MNNFKWPLINNNIASTDKEALAEFIVNSDRFTNGPKVREFEEAWSSWLGVKHSVMVNSGSSANYISTSIVRELKGTSSLFTSRQGEVIVPTIGWVSHVTSVINTGLVPVFVDVSLDNMSINSKTIAEAITPQTKAIVLVHCLGFNAIRDDIVHLARSRGLLLIEDCCEGPGATHDGVRVGTFGDISCFSFYFGHHITTIEGGMVCTNNSEIYELARLFRSHGMTREVSKETHEKYYVPGLNPLFTFGVAGYNMRSTELNAVLGLCQLPRLDEIIKVRSDNLLFWLESLSPDMYFTDFSTAGSSNFALPLILKVKSDSALSSICKILEEERVEYRLGTAGGGNQYRQPYLEKFNHQKIGKLPISNHIHDYGLYIGNHTDLKHSAISSLCKKLNNL